jgi:aspartate kinase
VTNKIVVQKFGGSSVADENKIRQVALKVKARADLGFRVVVVVSAMGDTTDELLAQAKKISPNPPRRELDMLLTCGERISMALMSMALQQLGAEAISFTGSQSGIITDDAHAQAQIIEVRPARIEEALAQNKIVIVAGYQGVSRQKEVTTLGRGGSDTTAVALAAALGADCEIYSDVDGIFTADPRVVVGAQKLDSIGYDEMQELAAAGAKVLNAQAVEFAKSRGISIAARSTHGSGTGTRIGPTVLKKCLKGVTCETTLWLLSGESALDVTSFLRAHAINARNLLCLGQRCVALVALHDVHHTQAIKDSLPTTLHVEENLASVTCVGLGLDAQAVTRVLELAEGHAVRACFSSTLQITLVVEKEAAAALTQQIHASLVVL